jgi:hypothetical protein
MSLRFTPILLCAAALAGCDERASAGTPDAAAPPPTVSAKPPNDGAASGPKPRAPSEPAAPSATSSAAPAAPAGEFKVLKLSFTSEVKNKEPTDALKSAEPGQRVYAHLTMRNRTDAQKPIRLAFLVGGVERTKIDLKVDPSWSYRTWGYVTLRAADAGEVVAEVRDDTGNVMERARLPIKGDAPGKPQKKAPPTDE